jgi:putative membrane protein
VLAIVFGAWLWLGYGIGSGGGWMHLKLALVAVLVALHVYLWVLLRAFREDRNRHGHVFYRWLNEIPALPILFVVVYLAVAKPF